MTPKLRQVLRVPAGWSEELDTAILVEADRYCWPAQYYPVAPIPQDERAIKRAMDNGGVKDWYQDGRYMMIPASELNAVIRELMELGEDAYDFATAICSTLSIEVGK